MKKILPFLLFMLSTFLLVGCGGNVKNVEIAEYDSEIYSHEEIDDAMEAAMAYFKKEFSGCTLRELKYIGDEQLSGYEEFALRIHARDVIVLVSTFEVDSSGGDGSLNPNSTYTNWKWILGLGADGRWQHIDHGY